MPDTRILVNPLLQKLSREKPTVPLAGYIGSTENGKVRIYRDLSLQAFLDIPQEDVVEFIEGKGPEHRAKLFFRTAATVSFTKKLQLGDRISFQKSATFTVDEVKRIVTLQRPSTRSGCTCEGHKGGEQQRQRGGGGIIGSGGLGFLPPEWCELNCAQWFSICDELPIWEMIWCYIDYMLCILSCGQSGTGLGDRGGSVID